MIRVPTPNGVYLQIAVWLTPANMKFLGAVFRRSIGSYCNADRSNFMNHFQLKSYYKQLTVSTEKKSLTIEVKRQLWEKEHRGKTEKHQEHGHIRKCQKTNDFQKHAKIYR